MIQYDKEKYLNSNQSIHISILDIKELSERVILVNNKLLLYGKLGEYDPITNYFVFTNNDNIYLAGPFLYNGITILKWDPFNLILFSSNYDEILNYLLPHGYEDEYISFQKELLVEMVF